MVKGTRHISLVLTAHLVISVDGWQAPAQRRFVWRRLHQGIASEGSCTTIPPNATAWEDVVVDLVRNQPPSRASPPSSVPFRSSESDEITPSEAASPRSICFGGVGRLYSTTAASGTERTGKDSPILSESTVLDRLQQATVVVVGVGGVGSWAAEALGRSGVGHVVVVDLDDVCRSNINRQLHALHSTVGQLKVDVLRARLVDISPSCNVTCIRDFVSSDNIHDILDSVQPPPEGETETTTSISSRRRGGGGRRRRRMVVLDAMDGGADKAALVSACVARRIPIVVCGGAAGRTDPTSVRVSDLTRIQDDRLLQSLRRNLRRYHGFPEGAPFRKKQPSPWKIPTVHSIQKEASPQGLQSSSSSPSSLRRCDSDLGTACFVTGSFGFAAAGCVVDMIANEKYKVPYVRR
jgi:tRNA threonylcarbamoyladenosine dehydratase